MDSRRRAEIAALAVKAREAIRRELRGAPPPEVPAGSDLRAIVGFPGYAIGRDRIVWTFWKGAGICRAWREMSPAMRGRNRTTPSVVLTDDRGGKHYRSIEQLYREAFLAPPLPDGDPGLEEIEDVDDLAEDARLGMPAVAPLPPRRRCPVPIAPPPSPARLPLPPSRPDPLSPPPDVEALPFGPHARGSDSPTAKLDEARVIELRALFPSLGAPALARRYGVSEATVYNAATGRTWKHVPGAISGRSLTARERGL